MDILQSGGGIDQNQTVIKLDSNVKKMLVMLNTDRALVAEELEKQRELQQANLEHSRNISGGIGGSGVGAGSSLTALSILSNERKLNALDAKIRKYDSPNGKRSYALDQPDQILRNAPYIGSYGPKFSINSFGESLYC